MDYPARQRPERPECQVPWDRIPLPESRLRGRESESTSCSNTKQATGCVCLRDATEYDYPDFILAYLTLFQA
jgi:hypothetical protein